MPIPRDRRPDYDRRRALDAHGITPEDVQSRMQTQGSKCPICNDRLARYTLDIHPRTATLRGLLCRRCSTLLAMSQQDTEIHRNAIRYLDGLSNINVPNADDYDTL